MAIIRALTRKRVVIPVLILGVLAVAVIVLLPLLRDDSLSAEEHLQRAVAHQSEGRLRAASIELRNALQAEPNMAEARLRLGEIHFAFGSYEGAAKEIERARSLGASGMRVFSTLGRSWLKRGEFENVLEKISEQDAKNLSDRAEILTLHGEAKLALGAREEAVRLLNEARLLDRSLVSPIAALTVLALDKGDVEGAEALLAEARENHPTAPEVDRIEGDLAFRINAFERSLAAYRRFVEKRPHNLFDQIPLAGALVATDNDQEAIEVLDKVLKALPKHGTANYFRAMAAYKTGDVNGALSHALTTLDQDSDFVGALLVAGAASFALESYEQAYRYLSAAGARAVSEDAQLMLATTLLRLGRVMEALTALERFGDTDNPRMVALMASAAIQNADFDKGLEYLARFAALNPENADALGQLGLLKVGLGHQDEGIADLERAFQIDPTLDATRFRMFRAHLSRGDYTKALEIALSIQETRPDSPVPPTMAGAVHAAAGRFGEAEAQFRKALEISPNAPGASVNLANVLIATGRGPEARSVLASAVAAHPTNPGLLVRLSDLALRDGDTQTAQQHLERAVEHAPESIRPSAKLATLHLSAGNPLRAVAVIQPVVQANPTSRIALEVLARAHSEAGAYDQAGATLAKLVGVLEDRLERARAESADDAEQADAGASLNALTDHLARAYWALARARNAGGQPALGLQAFRDAAARLPDHLPTIYRLAQLLIANGDLTEAGRATATLLEKTPDHPMVQTLRARLALETGEPGAALTVVEPVLAAYPDFSDALAVRAGAHLRLDHPDDAIADFRRAIALDAENLLARFSLAEAQLQAGRVSDASETAGELQTLAPESPLTDEMLGRIALASGDGQAAIAHFERSLGRQDRGSVAQRLAATYWALGDREASLRTLVEWLDRHPTDTLTRVILGIHYGKLDRHAEAVASYQAAVDTDPDYWLGHHGLALAHMALDDLDTALDHATQAAALTDDNADALRTLGIILAARGEHGRAVEVLQQATANAPERPELQYLVARSLAASGDPTQARQILETLLAADHPFKERSAAEALLAELAETP